MSRKTIEIQCNACSGTGLYAGMGEMGGVAVVCDRCGGTGKVDYTYTEFTGRKRKNGIVRVLHTNPGMFLNAEAVGEAGLSYKDWQAGKAFAPGTELRARSCPMWWYQSADYDKAPNWSECTYGSFKECEHYNNKDNCWRRWDSENKDK